MQSSLVQEEAQISVEKQNIQNENILKTNTPAQVEKSFHSIPRAIEESVVPPQQPTIADTEIVDDTEKKQSNDANATPKQVVESITKKAQPSISAPKTTLKESEKKKPSASQSTPKKTEPKQRSPSKSKKSVPQPLGNDINKKVESEGVPESSIDEEKKPTKWLESDSSANSTPAANDGQNELQHGDNETNEGQDIGFADKKKRAPPGSGPNKKSFTELVRNACMECDDKKGIAHQTVKKIVQDQIKTNSTRFQHNLTVAIKKLLDDGVIVKAGQRYRMSAGKGTKLKQEYTLKKQKKEEKEFKMRLKKGLVGVDEIEERRKAEEDAKKAEEAHQAKLARRRMLAAQKKAEAGGDKPVVPKTKAVVEPVAVVPGDIPISDAKVFGELMSITEFCCEFSKILRLEPFTCEMLHNALTANEFSSLVREIHMTILTLLFEPQFEKWKDPILLRLDWAQMLTPATWQELLRRYINRAIAYHEADFDHNILDTCCDSLAAKDYASMRYDQKVAVLSLLMHECYSHPKIIAIIDAKVEARQDLMSQKFHQDAAHRTKINELKEELKQYAVVKKPSKESKNKNTKNSKDNGEGSKDKDTTEKDSKNNEAKEPERDPFEKQRKICNERIGEAQAARDGDEAKYHRDLFLNRLRSEPIGTDKHGNEIWYFKGDPYRIYLYGTRVHGEKVESREEPIWRAYDKPEDVDTYIGVLDKSNATEKLLRRSMNMLKPIIMKKVTIASSEGGATLSVDEELARRLVEEEEELIRAENTRTRHRRGAAEAAEKLIKDASRSQVREGKKRITWDERDPNAFRLYRNTRNDVEGQELDIERVQVDKDAEDTSNPLLQLFVKDAERPHVMAQLLKRDLGDLADYVEENDGSLTNEGGREQYDAQVETAFESFQSTSSSYWVPEASRKILTNLLLVIEESATSTILLKKTHNVQKELERKERLRKQEEQKKEIAKMRAAQLKQYKRKAAKKKSKSKKQKKIKRKKLPSRKAAPKRVKKSNEPEITYTSSGRVCKGVSRLNVDESSTESEMDSSDFESDTEESEDTLSSLTSSESELEDSSEEVAEEHETNEDEEATAEHNNNEDEEAKNKANAEEALINEELDVPDDEKARVRLFQVKERLFPIGSGMRFEIEVKPEVVASTEEQVDLKRPVRVARTFVNGVVMSFHPVTFVSKNDMRDRWTVKLVNGDVLERDQDEMQIAADERWHWDRKHKHDTERDQTKAEVLASASIDDAIAQRIRNMWGSNSERQSWTKAMEAAMTIGAWSCVAQQLMNRVYVNNSLRQ